MDKKFLIAERFSLNRECTKQKVDFSNKIRRRKVAKWHSPKAKFVQACEYRYSACKQVEGSKKD